MRTQNELGAAGSLAARTHASYHDESQEAGLTSQIIIVGAGISGIGMAIELKRRKIEDFILLEAAEELGGTWRDNTYPGVAVDIPSFSYSFSFEPNPDWSRLFAPGAEIKRYVRHCADKYGISPHIRYRAEVKQAVFDPQASLWSLRLADQRVLRARFVIVATGILNQPILPDIAGLDTFQGKMFHTKFWDHAHDLSGQRVAIIGTGASAVQVVPAIAPCVQQLDVYQRTPIWILPKVDPQLSERTRQLFKRLPASQAAIRLLIDTGMEIGYAATVYYKKLPGLTRLAEANALRYLRSQVADPLLQEKLTPRYGFGCKRPAISNTYLATFNRDNVNLRTEGIDHLDAHGIVSCDGVQRAYDTIILATGFKTQELGNNPSFEVYGLDGLELGHFWQAQRYQAFNGVSVPRFPNLFLTFGPYSGGLNWFTMIEANSLYIGRCLQQALEQRAVYVEVKQEYHDRYFQLMLKKSRNTLFKNGPCAGSRSYYFDQHGDASLPTPFPPAWRWLRVRLTSLDSHRYAQMAPIMASLPQSEQADSTNAILTAER